MPMAQHSQIGDGQAALPGVGVLKAHPSHPDGADVRDYIGLLKPRVMSLVIFTALVGIVGAPGSLHPLLAALALLCIAVGAGASGALNMWWDADIDAVMARTAKRPIPSGRLSADSALIFAIILAGGSVVCLALIANWAAAALLAFTIFFYAVIYTIWIKRRTPQNIVIGGLAGALPPLIGWVAVTGGIAIEPLIWVAIIFIWTPPHFWALALLTAEEYKRAQIPMLPVVMGRRITRRWIVIYALLLMPCGFSPYFLGYSGIYYGVVSALGGVGFVWLALRLWRAGAQCAGHAQQFDPDHGEPPVGQQERRDAIRLFSFSIIYLFGLFTVIFGEKLAVIILP